MVAEVLQAHVRHLLAGLRVEEDVQGHELVRVASEPEAAGQPPVLVLVTGGVQVQVVTHDTVRDRHVRLTHLIILIMYKR